MGPNAQMPPAGAAPITAQSAPAPNKGFNFRMLLIILGVIVLMEVIWAVWTLAKNQNKSAPPISYSSPAPIVTQTKTSSALLALQTASLDVFVDQDIPVDIALDTDKASVDGVDVIISFDPAMLKVMPQTVNGKQVPVKVGTQFSDYPQNALEKGKITLSAISTSVPFSGKGILGTVTFKALKIGAAQIKIEYIPNSTTDSNIAQTGSAKDILSKVLDLTLQINPK